MNESLKGKLLTIQTFNHVGTTPINDITHQQVFLSAVEGKIIDRSELPLA